MPWTNKEIDLLCEMWGTYSTPVIAKRLGRTEIAIRSKAIDLGLGRSIYNSDRLPLMTIFKEFKMDKMNSFYTKVLEKRGFKLYSLKATERSYKMVDLDDFWKFAKNNLHIFDFSRLEVNALGAEPKWVKKARENAFKKHSIVNRKDCPWSPQEDASLVRLLNMKTLTCAEIAKRLQRPERSISWRMSLLGLEKNSVKEKVKIWTTKEVDCLNTLLNDGKSYEEISTKIKRSVSSIRHKVKQIYLTENIAKVREIIEPERKENE